MNPIRLQTRSFFSLRRKPFPIPSGPLLPQEKSIDEETCPGYGSRQFYPARPDDLFDNRYQLLAKVGWGISSTVWLARDMRGHRWQPETVVALKITNANLRTEGEREIEERIAKTGPSHRGYSFLRAYSDSFAVAGTEGTYSCLAYDPMREPMSLFRRRFTSPGIPFPTVKVHVLVLLMGLDYLHSVCKIVHTDLKLENIMMTFEDPAILGDIVNHHLNQQSPYKLDSTGRPVSPRNNDFGQLRKVNNIPQIADFGSSTTLDHPNGHGIYPIQPEH